MLLRGFGRHGNRRLAMPNLKAFTVLYLADLIVDDVVWSVWFAQPRSSKICNTSAFCHLCFDLFLCFRWGNNSLLPRDFKKCFVWHLLVQICAKWHSKWKVQIRTRIRGTGSNQVTAWCTELERDPQRQVITLVRSDASDAFDWKLKKSHMPPIKENVRQSVLMISSFYSK